MAPGRGPAPWLFLFGALEEPGWRGYVQEGLQRRCSVAASSLLIGLFWAVWLLPLFLLPGTYQAGLGVATPAFWSFILALAAVLLVAAWSWMRVSYPSATADSSRDPSCR